MKQRLHQKPQSTKKKLKSPQKPTPPQNNQLELTRNLTQDRNVTPETVVAAQGVIGNQAVMRLIAEQPMLRWGSRGDDVIALQQLLNQKMDAGLTEDGIFGPLTFKAVTTFQKENNLSVDGIVGPMTWSSLNQGGKESPPQPAPPENEDKKGQELVSSMQTVKTLLEGFAMASEGDMTSFNLDDANPGVDDPAMTEVMPIVGNMLEQHQTTDNHDVGTNVPVAVQHNVTNQKEKPDPPEVAIPKLFNVIKDMIPNLPANLKAKFGALLVPMGKVVAQIVSGAAPTDAMITTFNKATADLIKVANTIQVPAAPDGSSTVFNLEKPTTWKSNADTIADLSQDLENHSPHGEAAFVMAHPEIDNDTENDKTKEVSIVIRIEMELPEWTKAESVGQKCPCWKQEWDKFSAAIQAHEQQHIAIYKLFYSNLHIRCLGKTQSQADKIFDDTVDAAENAQKHFDDATKHGVLGVPSTKFNGGRSCKGC